MSETGGVRPALTVEEWEWEAVDHPADTGVASIEFGRLVVTAECDWPFSMEVHRPHAVAALALHSLPGGDPRKPTWQMVDDLRKEARAWYYTDDEDKPYPPLEEVADLLESLLPPREHV